MLAEKRSAADELRRSGDWWVLLPDDTSLHRAQRGQQFILLRRSDVVFVERLDEILHRRVPLGVGDLHPGVDRLHVAANVRARSARRVTDLVREVRPELEDLLGLERLEP